MERFETRLEGDTLNLDFTTSPAMYAGKEGMPHASGSIYLDICGQFTLTAELDGMTLTTLDNVTIKPYASFHTMWEIYDELLRLADEGDDNSATPRPYVEYGVMGQSYHGYDMPYLIVARDSRAVQKWLDLSQQAEETGTAVIEALRRSADTDYQVPILYSNIHANDGLPELHHLDARLNGFRRERRGLLGECGRRYVLLLNPAVCHAHGCVGYTVELPAYSEVARQAASYGLLGLSDCVAANKERYFADFAEIYVRGAENRNSDAQVGPWFVDEHDNVGADARSFHPAHAGEEENGQFFPECYLIPLDAAHQANLQAAFDMIEWLTRNDVKVGVVSTPIVADGRTLPPEPPWLPCIRPSGPWPTRPCMAAPTLPIGPICAPRASQPSIIPAALTWSPA